VVDPRPQPPQSTLIFNLAFHPGTDLALLYGLAPSFAARRTIDHDRFIDREPPMAFPPRRRAEGSGRQQRLLHLWRSARTSCAAGGTSYGEAPGALARGRMGSIEPWRDGYGGRA